MPGMAHNLALVRRHHPQQMARQAGGLRSNAAGTPLPTARIHNPASDSEVLEAGPAHANGLGSTNTLQGDVTL